MSFKGWLQRKKEVSREDYTPDELIALERFDEAKEKLQKRLRYHPKDLNAHLKLAEVYRHLGATDSCKQEYLFVAGAYAEDGFYDRARAVLTKFSRFFPAEIDVEKKMAALQRAKDLDITRQRARAGLLAHTSLASGMSGRLAVEFEQVWGQLTDTTLLDQISSEDFARLFENSSLRRFEPDAVLVERGDDREVLFLVVRGTIDARVLDKKGHLITLRSFGLGEIVGDRALFEHRPWPAQYHTEDHLTALELASDGLAKLIEGHADPKRLLDILRGQGNDVVVQRAVDHISR